MFLYGTASGVSGSMTGFALPPGAKAIYLQPSSTGLVFELTVPTSPTGLATTSDLRGAFLQGPNVLNGPFRVPPADVSGRRCVVAIYNAVGGNVSVRVFVAPTS